MGRAALWRAARSGLEGDLVDVTVPEAGLRREVVTNWCAGAARNSRPRATGTWSANWPTGC